MSQIIKLYKKQVSMDSSDVNLFENNKYTLKIHRPTIFSLGLDNSERCRKFLWYIITKGRFRIIYILDDKKVIHYSFIIPRNFRFPFMSHEDLQIGPCYTDTGFRNCGVYSKVLKTVPGLYKDINRTLWIYTTQNNIISQHVIEKAGYEFCGYYMIKSILRILKPITST